MVVWTYATICRHGRGEGKNGKIPNDILNAVISEEKIGLRFLDCIFVILQKILDCAQMLKSGALVPHDLRMFIKFRYLMMAKMNLKYSKLSQT